MSKKEEQPIKPTSNDSIPKVIKDQVIIVSTNEVVKNSMKGDLSTTQAKKPG